LYFQELKLLAQLLLLGLGTEVLIGAEELGDGISVGVGVGLVVVTGEGVEVVDGLGLAWLVQVFLRQ
jgi:hypothetical protein